MIDRHRWSLRWSKVEKVRGTVDWTTGIIIHMVTNWLIDQNWINTKKQHQCNASGLHVMETLMICGGDAPDIFSQSYQLFRKTTVSAFPMSCGWRFLSVLCITSKLPVVAMQKRPFIVWIGNAFHMKRYHNLHLNLIWQCTGQDLPNYMTSRTGFDMTGFTKLL